MRLIFFHHHFKCHLYEHYNLSVAITMCFLRTAPYLCVITIKPSSPFIIILTYPRHYYTCISNCAHVIKLKAKEKQRKKRDTDIELTQMQTQMWWVTAVIVVDVVILYCTKCENRNENTSHINISIFNIEAEDRIRNREEIEKCWNGINGRRYEDWHTEIGRLFRLFFSASTTSSKRSSLKARPTQSCINISKLPRNKHIL